MSDDGHIVSAAQAPITHQPGSSGSATATAKAVAAMQGFRSGLNLDGLTVREPVEEGRRY
jgi:hypothetical protein